MRSSAALIALLLLPLTACASGDSEVPADNSTGNLTGAEPALNVQANATASVGSGIEPDTQAIPQNTSLASQETAAVKTIDAAKNKPKQSPDAQGSPCMTQDGKALSAARGRAAGTEPFWGANIEGRCVTYSHAEDQDGTRIWTRAIPARGGGSWSGALGGRRFELRVRPEPGCSDGMSDKRYPLAAELTLGSEQRRGCAEPLSG
jgi:uncharacterized membrane protein